MSKKLVPAEWISIRYLSVAGVGVGTVVTWRSRGPWVNENAVSLRWGIDEP